MVKIQVNSQGKAYMTSNGKVLLAQSGGSTPVIESLSITPTTSSQIITAPSGTDGYSPVNVSAVTAAIDQNISAGNIKKDVQILGVTGTYEGSGGGIGITREVKNGVYQMPTENFTFSLPNDATDIGDYALYYAFYNCSRLTSVDLSSLTTVSGQGAFVYAFYNCSRLTSVDLSSLTTISSRSGLKDAFYECSTITSVDLSSLTTVGDSGLTGAFSNNRITSVNLSNLTTVGDYGLNNTFPGNKITSVDLSSLTTIGYAGLVAAFAHNTDSQGQTTLTSISFPALTSQSFGESTNQFGGMLEGDEGVVVHFPFNLKSTMSSWDDVTNGFGGTNTTVLFDLNGCELTFNITPNTGNRLSVNGDESSSNTCPVAKSSMASYQIYNSSYGLYISEYSAPDADSATVTVDITTPTYNTISLNTGVSGLTATVTIDDVDYSLTETGTTGVYTINIYKTISDSVSVNYFVNGGNSYMDENGTLTFNNNDISETITMTPATEGQFVRPNLTSNGTLGGNSFAVYASSDMISEPAFYAVDDDLTSACKVGGMIGFDNNTWLKYTFYNPVALKTTAIGLKLYNIPDTPSLTFEASDDNINWTTLTVTNTDTSTDYVISSLDNTIAYKYYKITLKPANEWDDYSNCGISDITITAPQKVPAV